MIDNETIINLIKAGQKAPSWKNTQVSRYYAVNTPENILKLRECLHPYNQNNTENAGAIIVTTVEDGIIGVKPDGSYSSHLKDGFQYFDNGLQVENICLTAKSMGLGTLIMGLYNEAQIREFFNIPESQIIVCVIAVGVPAVSPDMPVRKEIDEILTIK